MEKEFVDYTESLELKALGFDEPCFAFYQKEYNEIKPTMVGDDDQYRLTGYRTCKNSEIPEQYTSAPTYSQAFRFFREKYRLWQIVQQNTDKDWTYDIMPITGMIDYELFDVFDTYEEAELECLKKLIELVKEKQL